MSSPAEDTPLLSRSLRSDENLKREGLFSPYRRVLLATLLLSTTFWFTATPLIYAYRVFDCQEYYEDPAHPPYAGEGDACAISAIETTTAKDIGIMVILSTFSGTANLLLTTWQIRNWGLRSAIVHQTFWPSLRNLTQIYATFTGGRVGITIMQSTQLITILGGGMGYMLSANSYINEVVEPAERTVAFGVLAGMSMLGTAIGYVAGGLAGELINISAPFEITFCLLVLSTLYTRFLLPYIPPTANHSPAGKTKQQKSRLAFLACLLVFLPIQYANGRGRFWGLALLAFGTFCGSLATGYVPMMLQLTATNKYGYKMSTLSLSRALFLTFAFPRIIAVGRRWIASAENLSASAMHRDPETNDEASSASSGTSTPSIPAPETLDRKSGLSPIDSSAFVPPPVEGPDAAPAEPPTLPLPADAAHGSRFDLAFLQWSMVVDAVLTALVAFSSRAWHINAAALILPLASGTAPACKGVLMDMVPDDPEIRADALAGISLVETLAWISTVSLFGTLFAFLSEIGRPNLVFFCNAAMAVAAACVLFAVRFPRGGLAIKRRGVDA